MTQILRGNWSLRDPGDDIASGDEVVSGNFSQLNPDTPILVGKTLTIRGGNWINVRRQPQWTITGGNWAQISRCSHEHPDWVAKGLDECVENCSHVADTDEIWLDGQLIDTIYHYADTVQ